MKSPETGWLLEVQTGVCMDLAVDLRQKMIEKQGKQVGFIDRRPHREGYYDYSLHFPFKSFVREKIDSGNIWTVELAANFPALDFDSSKIYFSKNNINSNGDYNVASND